MLHVWSLGEDSWRTRFSGSLSKWSQVFSIWYLQHGNWSSYKTTQSFVKPELNAFLPDSAGQSSHRSGYFQGDGGESSHFSIGGMFKNLWLLLNFKNYSCVGIFVITLVDTFLLLY